MSEEDKPYRITLTVEPALIEGLKLEAAKDRRTMGAQINHMISEYLRTHQGLEIEPQLQHGGDRKSQSAKAKRAK